MPKHVNVSMSRWYISLAPIMDMGWSVAQPRPGTWSAVLRATWPHHAGPFLIPRVPIREGKFAPDDPHAVMPGSQFGGGAYTGHVQRRMPPPTFSQRPAIWGLAPAGLGASTIHVPLEIEARHKLACTSAFSWKHIYLNKSHELLGPALAVIDRSTVRSCPPNEPSNCGGAQSMRERESSRGIV